MQHFFVNIIVVLRHYGPSSSISRRRIAHQAMTKSPSKPNSDTIMPLATFRERPQLSNRREDTGGSHILYRNQEFETPTERTETTIETVGSFCAVVAESAKRLIEAVSASVDVEPVMPKVRIQKDS